MSIVSDVQLNASQKAVVIAGNQPILVVAGPGAGKTTVLKERIERLLLESGDYSRVLAVTFTNVAAANLREKLEDLNSDLVSRVVAGTFHSFAARILQQHGNHVGLRPDFNISNEDSDRRELYDEALNRVGWQPEANSNYLPLLSRLMERGATRDSVAHFIVPGLDAEMLGKTLEAYLDVSVERGQLDFALLIYMVNRLFGAYPAIARQVRKTYGFICIDEFQDTNDAQFRLLHHLCATNANGLLLLADQDQVIYQWNGASTGRLKEAVDAFGCQVLVLPTSFRCPDLIVSAANHLISHNVGRFVGDTFQSAIEEPGQITIKSFNTEALEEQWIAEQLQNLPSDERSETAVLSRNKKRLESLLRQCEEHKLPVVIPAPRFEFVSPPFVVLHSMMRLAQRFQSRHLERLCSAFAAMTGSLLDAGTLAAEAAASDEPALQAFVTATRPLLSSATYDDVCDYIERELLARKEYRDFSTTFLKWVSDVVASTNGATFAQDYEDELPVWKFLEQAHKGLVSDRVPLGEFLRRLELESKSPEIPDAIKLMTVHGAKGLEYRNVFIMGASEGQFPAFQAAQQGADSDAMREERRSFFVAITRCKANLTITYPTTYMGYRKQPSRFIAELELSPH